MSLTRLAAAFGLAGATALSGCAAYVTPRGDVSVGLAPLYVAPAPRYYAPVPRYYAPAPAYIYPRPSYGRYHYGR